VFTNYAQSWIKHKVNSDERYSLRLQSDFAGRVFIRLTDGRKTSMVSDDFGSRFKWLPSLPGKGNPISPYNTKLHPATALVSVIDDDKLYIYDLSRQNWYSRSLPSGIKVNDISINSKGELWCAGSVSSKRLPNEDTEAAIRYQSSVGQRFISRSPQLNPFTASRIIRYGGLSELRTIDSEADPVICTSNCSWLLDDPSSFVFIFFPKKTIVKRFKGELICSTERLSNGLIRVFTYAGNLWTFNGKCWHKFSLVSSINNALFITNRKILIRGLDSRNEQIVTAVEVAPEGAGDFVQNPDFTAVCISEDGGNSFQVRKQFFFKDDKEIQDVALL